MLYNKVKIVTRNLLRPSMLKSPSLRNPRKVVQPLRKQLERASIMMTVKTTMMMKNSDLIMGLRVMRVKTRSALNQPQEVPRVLLPREKIHRGRFARPMMEEMSKKNLRSKKQVKSSLGHLLLLEEHNVISRSLRL